jgi:hypothetical protein|tara:strand:- start:41087 stop:41299 length:213 start_codon:yes stop_codon:yes gene_type:complete
MSKWYVLSFDRGDIIIFHFKAKDTDNAYQIFEEDIQTNFSTDILLDESDFEKMRKMLKNYKGEQDYGGIK